MADLDLDALAELLEAATPGRWAATESRANEDDRVEIDVYSYSAGLVATFVPQWRRPGSAANARAIAALHNAAPALIAATRDLAASKAFAAELADIAEKAKAERDAAVERAEKAERDIATVREQRATSWEAVGMYADRALEAERRYERDRRNLHDELRVAGVILAGGSRLYDQCERAQRRADGAEAELAELRAAAQAVVDKRVCKGCNGTGRVNDLRDGACNNGLLHVIGPTDDAEVRALVAATRRANKAAEQQANGAEPPAAAPSEGTT